MRNRLFSTLALVSLICCLLLSADFVTGVLTQRELDPLELGLEFGLLLITAGLPVRWFSLKRARLRRQREQQGLCPACGYDLRANPQRCPECGHWMPFSPAVEEVAEYLTRVR